MSIRIITYSLLLLLLYSCNISRHMPAGEKLYGGNEIIIDKAASATAQEAVYAEKKAIAAVAQKENKATLGFPFPAYLYYKLGDPLKDKGFRKWMRRRFAATPITDKTIHTALSAQMLQSTMQQEGYFQTTVSADTIHKKYKAIARYTIHLKPRYYLDTIHFNTDSTQLRQEAARILKMPESNLQTGAPYRLDDFKAERERISYKMKQQGYFYLDAEQFTSIADTFSTKHGVNLVVDLAQPLQEKARQQYYIRDIRIYPNYTLNNLEKNDTTAAQLSPGGLQIFDNKHTFKLDMFDDLITYQPGTLYNIQEMERTFNRLYGAGVFRFVTSAPEAVNKPDPPLLNISYYLTPLSRKAIQFETGGNTKSNNSYGVQLALSWSNRNTFKRGELLYVRLNGGADLQFLGREAKSYNYKGGIETGISFPKFLIPFFQGNFSKAYNMRTIFSTGYDMLIRSSLYNVHAYKLNYSYAWKTNVNTDLTLTPLSINYLQHYNIKEADLLDPANASYKNILNTYLSNELIIGSQFNYTYTNHSEITQRNYFAFSGNLELAGNLLGLIKRAGMDGDSLRKLILKVPFAQYTKADLDFRYYHKVSSHVQWANRLFLGIGLPYGNSGFLPLVKQYFAGGSNGLRAFRPQTIGPGAFHIPDTLDTEMQNFFRNTPQSGDIKVELSTELRFPVLGNLQGAVFIDAGNVWVKKVSFFYDLAEQVIDSTRTSFSNKAFSSTFYKELGVGGGLGLRLNFPFLIIRADLAMPFRKPWLPEGQRWVFDQIALLSPEWRKENLVLNFGIGYPF